jgi:hypothetical protein
MNHQHDHHNHPNQTVTSNATFSGITSNQTINGTAEVSAALIKTAPHTLEALMEGANGTATAGGGGRHKNGTGIFGIRMSLC